MSLNNKILAYITAMVFQKMYLRQFVCTKYQERKVLDWALSITESVWIDHLAIGMPANKAQALLFHQEVADAIMNKSTGIASFSLKMMRTVHARRGEWTKLTSFLCWFWEIVSVTLLPLEKS